MHEAGLRVLPLSHWLPERDDEGGHLEQAEGFSCRQQDEWTLMSIRHGNSATRRG